ncbi:MAG: dTDP-4-dehydrorhamnose reductase [Alistipes sp.]|nr:dTDP-4-dehydrorhamnose reductase [Alistipes sp.]
MLDILITGGSGQLAQALLEASAGSVNRYTAADSMALDITDGDAVEHYLATKHTDIIVNCAAYTDVERAESDASTAMLVNASAVGEMSDAAHRHGVKLIQLSTDFVFGGQDSTRPYTELDPAQPLNVYGRTKAEGEAAAMRHGDAIVIRTSWLYAPWGRNFCRTILDLAQKRDSIEVVDDQIGTPTYAPDLAEAIVGIIDSGAWRTMSGIYHYSDEGECSWYDFAAEILRQAGIDRCRIEPCPSSTRASAARRPRYSVLDKSRIKRETGIAIPHWKESLARCIGRINELKLTN